MPPLRLIMHVIQVYLLEMFTALVEQMARCHTNADEISCKQENMLEARQCSSLKIFHKILQKRILYESFSYHFLCLIKRIKATNFAIELGKCEVLLGVKRDCGHVLCLCEKVYHNCTLNKQLNTQTNKSKLLLETKYPTSKTLKKTSTTQFAYIKLQAWSIQFLQR